MSQSNNLHIHHQLNTNGLICPEPVMLLHKTIRGAAAGDVVEVLATDPATTRDIPNFCHHLGHTLVSQETLTQATQPLLNADDQEDDEENDEHANISDFYRYLIQKKQP